MTRMHIAHIITCLLRGGAEENTVATCNAQVKRGHKVTIVCGAEVDEKMRSALFDSVNFCQIPTLHRPINFRNDYLAYRELISCIKLINPDAVHTHQSKAGILGRLAATRVGVPIIIHGVHILPFDNVSTFRRIVYLSAERCAASNTDAFICVSRGVMRENLAARLGEASNNFVVYSGMDLQRFKSAQPPRTAPKGRILIMISSLEKRKRHAAFLNVFAKLKSSHPDLRFVILGQGPERTSLENQARKLEILDSCIFAGYCDDIEHWISVAEIGILCSEREGLPRVVVQYLAGGCPVVATDVPGLDEILIDGFNGIIVKSRRVDDMHSSLHELLSDSNKLRRFRSNASATDVSRWDLKLMEPAIESIIQDILSRKAVCTNSTETEELSRY